MTTLYGKEKELRELPPAPSAAELEQLRAKVSEQGGRVKEAKTVRPRGLFYCLRLGRRGTWAACARERRHCSLHTSSCMRGHLPVVHERAAANTLTAPTPSPLTLTLPRPLPRTRATLSWRPSPRRRWMRCWGSRRSWRRLRRRHSTR